MSQKYSNGSGCYKRFVRLILIFSAVFTPVFEVFAKSEKSSVIDSHETEVVQTYSYGTRSCDEILLYTERKLVKKTLKIWVGGYLSGVSILLDKKHFNMTLIEIDQFFDEVILYCRNNPSDMFVNSASNVLVKYINE